MRISRKTIHFLEREHNVKNHYVRESDLKFHTSKRCIQLKKNKYFLLRLYIVQEGTLGWEIGIT